MDIKIVEVKSTAAIQNVAGKDEWHIWVGDNHAGCIYQERRNKGVCVSPLGEYGVNSHLRKWWHSDIDTLSQAKKFVLENFESYTPIPNQEFHNKHGVR